MHITQIHLVPTSQATGPICLLLKPLHSTENGVNSSIRLKARNLVSRQNKTLR